MLPCGIEKKFPVLELEPAAGIGDASFAKEQQLFAPADGIGENGPFFQRDLGNIHAKIIAIRLDNILHHDVERSLHSRSCGGGGRQIF